MATSIGNRRWALNIQQDWIDVTSSHPTPDERWRYTDEAGHEHRYERGYPTLTYVVDESHWCDGHEGIYNHDPHDAVDRYHYECPDCGEHIAPAVHPAFWPARTPGMVSYTATWLRADGAEVTAWLTPDNVEAIRANPGDDDVVALLDALPPEQIMRTDYTS